MANSYFNMKLILLLLIAFLGLAVLSCPPPFNVHRYLENGTLLDEVLRSRTNTSLGRRGAHGYTAGNPTMTTWPVVNGEVRIPICFENRRTRNFMRDLWNTAWGYWYQRIGDPGAQNGHRIAGFQETLRPDGLDTMFCFLPDRSWNPAVPVDAVAIIGKEAAGFSAVATLGYIPPAYVGNKPRHSIIVYFGGNKDIPGQGAIVAHEMGHIFGLMHEHQRPDRDQYVHFDCTKLPNYVAMVQRFKTNTIPGLTIAALCHDSVWPLHQDYRAVGWGFSAVFSTQPYRDPNHRDAQGNRDGTRHPRPTVPHGPYDIDSIMHYQSGTGFTAPITVSSVALVAWKQPSAQPPNQVDDQNAQLIPERRVPSMGDLRVIQHLYPW